MITETTAFDLSRRNTFRLPAKCAAYVEVTSPEDLLGIDFDSLPQPVKVIGGGSNLLLTGDFPGTMLHCDIKGIDPLEEDVKKEGDVHVMVGAGESFDSFCQWAAGRGLWGVENLSLIPGEAGAAAYQNIGAYGVEAADVVVRINAFDRASGKMAVLYPEDCAYGYRDSMFKHSGGRYIITSVVYRLSTLPSARLGYGGVRGRVEQYLSANPEEPLTPSLVRGIIISIRSEKLPPVEEVGSAGSFFCNPVVPRCLYDRIVEKEGTQVPHYDLPGDMVKIPAAWMIERCAFKGVCRGGAQVCPTQPLVIINRTGEATAGDILSLEEDITKAVFERFGIQLHPEVEHI